MKTRTRFVMIGGFLGAGKTTTIARLARMYQLRGHRVGIVTNDQATDLVDSTSLQAQGFAVGEVAGACFCCNFTELTETVRRLEASDRPDVLLAEPVGSCTDLVATVIQPILQLYAQKFDVAPYTVILKPSHGRRILRNEAMAGFSPKAAYIFRKQLEEADAVLINRVDELSPVEIADLAELVERERPGVPILQLSARRGDGFDALAEFLELRGEFGRRILDLDYDIYAEGEAELGWLNSSVAVTSKSPFPLDQLLLSIVGILHDTLLGDNAETAHLKIIGLADGAYGVANLVSSDSRPELSIASHANVSDVQLIVNARVAIDPAALTSRVQHAVEIGVQAQGAQSEFGLTQSFRPGRPIPTHRFVDAI